MHLHGGTRAVGARELRFQARLSVMEDVNGDEGSVPLRPGETLPLQKRWWLDPLSDPRQQIKGAERSRKRSEQERPQAGTPSRTSLMSSSDVAVREGAFELHSPLCSLRHPNMSPSPTAHLNLLLVAKKRLFLSSKAQISGFTQLESLFSFYPFFFTLFISLIASLFVLFYLNS